MVLGIFNSYLVQLIYNNYCVPGNIVFDDLATTQLRKRDFIF